MSNLVMKFVADQGTITMKPSRNAAELMGTLEEAGAIMGMSLIVNGDNNFTDVSYFIDYF